MLLRDEMNQKRKRRILEIARNVASKSNMKIKHGAVIFYRNRLVASGYNTRNYRLSNKFSIHAEQNALNDFFKQKKHKCGFDFFSLFVVRLSDTGLLMNSKPCCQCNQTLLQVPCINRVFYS
jgi:deoxycytidylate deaminase